jgi:hypothetical protein
MASIELPNHLIPRGELECILESDTVPTTIFLTLLALILTISIQCVVHLSSEPTSKTTTESQHPPNSLSEIDAPAFDTTGLLPHNTTEPTPIDAFNASHSVERSRSTEASTTAWCEPHPSPSTRARRLTRSTILCLPICLVLGFPAWCEPHPSPSTRARRFTRSTILLIPICLVLGLRMADRTSEECMRYIASSAPLNWWDIVLFIIAVDAWLRALIDCLLIRWGKGLRYPAKSSWGLGWPPFAPVSLVITVAASLVNKGAKWVMGKTVAENNDLELGENRGLIVGIDAENQDVHGPPAYEGLEGVRNEYLGMENELLVKGSH